MTIRRRLQENRLRGKIVIKKPTITPAKRKNKN